MVGGPGPIGGGMPPEMLQAKTQIDQERIPVTQAESPGGVYNAGLIRLGVTPSPLVEERGRPNRYVLEPFGHGRP